MRLARRRRGSMDCQLAAPTVLASILTSPSRLTHLHRYYHVTIGCVLLQRKVAQNRP